MDGEAGTHDQPVSEGQHYGLIRPLILLWLAGVSLRLTILALPAVLHSVEADLHLQGTDVGVLTAIPSAFFALAALPGAVLISRFGAIPSLLTGLVINGLGAAARGFAGDVISLKLTTALTCLGVAIMQPAMPTLARTWTPSRVALATATYTCGLLCGEVLPVLWTFAPELPWVGGGWRASLFKWAPPVFATAVVIAFLQPRARRTQARASRGWPKWRQTSLWRVGILLGALNASYFGLNGFLPGWLSKAGGASMVGPALLVLNASQIPAALMMMIFADRLVFRRESYLAGGFLVLTGSVGLATAPPEFALAFAAAAGFALASLLTLALALPPLIVTAREVPSFSAAVFTIGYATGVLTALVTGALESSGASPWMKILPIAMAALIVIAFGATMRSVRHGGSG